MNQPVFEEKLTTLRLEASTVLDMDVLPKSLLLASITPTARNQKTMAVSS